MPVERTAGSTSLVDVLDRVLDRGVRWDASARAAPGRATAWNPPRIVVTFMDVRTDDTPARGALPRAPSPGA
ncbi:hypothetical protein JY651_30525 [Pyxidicoccus parkwayensis]|uniref:Uncharacterized protein n=1 Tax=Pyxidicoccus parkwayensis TaxID=2813578 RepID=A0ABX7NL99_9BACT|nr:hypothetical protein [Pyxidicoccus parkwaysis]QSQ19635.1 hypothetical protein JY651_30525 [Pyxidicoccus parkwaysis]